MVRLVLEESDNSQVDRDLLVELAQDHDNADKVLEVIDEIIK